jgi:hypothetical protein
MRSYWGDYSFMYTYSAPKPAVISMWKSVLTEVLTGGWDQDQFRYWALNMSANITSEVIPKAAVGRSQNNFAAVTEARLQEFGRPYVA